MDLEHMIRTASALPKEDPERRSLVALIKIAISPDTEDFVEWVLATQKPMTESAMSRYLEQRLGRDPDPAPAKGQSGRKSGPLMVGEKVLVDKMGNTNTMNTDPCEKYHNRVGQVSDINSQGLVIQFYKGNNDVPSDELTQEKQFFDGFEPGKPTGLKRWTPRSDYQEHAVGKMVLFEAIYLAKPGKKPDPRHIEMIEAYVNKGTLSGEMRSRVYFSGPVGKFAFNQQGEVYAAISSMQRDHPTFLNPSQGKLLYIGIAGKRPAGWEDEAVKIGLRQGP